MADINLKLRIKSKGKKATKKPRGRKRNAKQKFLAKPENIVLKAHNPGAGNPIIGHQTPLVTEKPNIEQANRVNLLNQQVETQTKELKDNENKVTNLIEKVKYNQAKEINKL